MIAEQMTKKELFDWVKELYKFFECEDKHEKGQPNPSKKKRENRIWWTNVTTMQTNIYSVDIKIWCKHVTTVEKCEMVCNTHTVWTLLIRYVDTNTM